MTTRIHNSFLVPLEANEAYRVVTDIETVASCFPGARLNNAVDEDTYRGEIQLKLGPVQVAFAGQLEFTNRDAEGRTAKLRAKGKEKRGRGAANADIEVSVTPGEQDGAANALVQLDTDMKLAGAVAQYGRGAGVIQSVAEQILNEFAKNLEAEIAGTRDETEAAPVSGAGLLGRAVVDSIKGRVTPDDKSGSDS